MSNVRNKMASKTVMLIISVTFLVLLRHGRANVLQNLEKKLDVCRSDFCPNNLDPQCVINDRNELEIYPNKCFEARHRKANPINIYTKISQQCCMIHWKYCHHPHMSIYGTFNDNKK